MSLLEVFGILRGIRRLMKGPCMRWLVDLRIFKHVHVRHFDAWTLKINAICDSSLNDALHNDVGQTKRRRS